jgi:hypothetical protein
MARYWIAAPFSYTGKSGGARYVTFEGLPQSSRIFDTTDPRWDLPVGWLPPPNMDVLYPMDATAQTALQTARAPYAGQQWPGLGYIPAGAPPLFNP